VSQDSERRSCLRSQPVTSLRLFNDADHAFHVRDSSGSNDRAVLAALADAIAAWVGALER
jgi:hypothetical protein